MEGISTGLFRATEDDFFNCRKKYIITLEGQLKCIQTLVAEKSIFNPKKLEKVVKTVKKCEKLDKFNEALLQYQVENMTSALSDRLEMIHCENLKTSVRRAKRRIQDIVLANPDMEWFITFTLSGELFPRNDIFQAVKRLNKYLANRVQRTGLKYVFVPEFHSDGESVHFHGFVNGVLKFVPSGTYVPPWGGKPVKASTLKRKKIPLTECQEVFNVTDWGYGFSTAIKVYGEREKVASYIAKYIAKQVSEPEKKPSKIGGRWYYSGGELQEPFYEYENRAFSLCDGYIVDFPGCSMKIFDGEI